VAKNNTGFFWVTLYPILNSILIAFCLPKVEQLKSIQKHFDKFIVITSVTSYSLYLIGGSFMLVVIIIISKITHLKWYFLVVLFFIITYALAILNYKFFESKFINYRHRFVEKYIRS
jgi:peptidoglycan/LPS O-acetylase OafA/YrhL